MKQLIYITSILAVITACQNKEVASTPPLGWNSYTGYSTVAPENELIKNIDAVAKKLKPFGYEYITVDNVWLIRGLKYKIIQQHMPRM